MQNTLILIGVIISVLVTLYIIARLKILNELADDLSGNSHVGKVNIEEYQSLAQKFKVRNIPTMILFKNGKEVDRFVGVKSRDFLIGQMKKPY